MFKRLRAEAAAQREEGSAQFNGDMSAVHAREAEKYDRKADELEAAGKAGPARRHRAVAERNRRLAAKHAEKA